MKTLKFILAVSLAAGAVPAFAQAGDAKSSVAQMERAMQQTAARLGNARLNPAEARPPYQGKVNVDPSKDAWRPVTSEAMRQATSKDRSEERRVGKECVVRVDLGVRGSIKKKK